MFYLVGNNVFAEKVHVECDGLVPEGPLARHIKSL